MNFARHIYFKTRENRWKLILKDIVVIDVTQGKDVLGIGREVEAR